MKDFEYYMETPEKIEDTKTPTKYNVELQQVDAEDESKTHNISEYCTKKLKRSKVYDVFDLKKKRIKDAKAECKCKVKKCS